MHFNNSEASDTENLKCVNYSKYPAWISLALPVSHVPG